MRGVVAISVSLILLMASISMAGEKKEESIGTVALQQSSASAQYNGSGGVDDAAHFKYHQNDSNIINWYEWWYANAKGDDGNNLLIEFFTFGNLNNPFVSAVGIVMIFMKSDGSTFKSLKSYPLIDYNLDYEKCNVTIAGDIFAENDDGTYTVTYHNSINDVKLQLNLSKINRGIEAIPTSAGNDEWMKWNIPVPYGKADGLLEYTDIKGHHVYRIAGRGYHDHNWGISNKFSLCWDWGEFSDGSASATITYGMVRFGDGPSEGGIYFSNETVRKAIYIPDLTIKYMDWDTICGFKKPTKFCMYGSNGSFSVNVTVEIERAYIIGVGRLGMPYLMGKMNGIINVNGKSYKFSDVTGFYEHHFLKPTVNWPW